MSSAHTEEELKSIFGPQDDASSGPIKIPDELKEKRAVSIPGNNLFHTFSPSSSPNSSALLLSPYPADEADDYEYEDEYLELEQDLFNQQQHSEDPDWFEEYFGYSSTTKGTSEGWAGSGTIPALCLQRECGRPRLPACSRNACIKGMS